MRCRIVGVADRQLRRTGLGIPAFELLEVRPIGVGHRRDKIITGHGLPIMALEVQIHAAPEAVLAQQGLHHADHFRAFVVNGHGVEIVDFDIGIGTDRMRHRPGVLRELTAAENADIFNALDSA